MPQTSWQALPDGNVAFDGPGGPLVLGGAEASAEAARRDAAAGSIRPLSDYQAIARREPMATSPGALADASGGAAGAGSGDPSQGPPAGPAPSVSDAEGVPMPDRPLQWSQGGGTPAFSGQTPPPPNEGPPLPPPAEPPEPGRGGAFGSGSVNPYDSERKSQETEAG